MSENGKEEDKLNYNKYNTLMKYILSIKNARIWPELFTSYIFTISRKYEKLPRIVIYNFVKTSVAQKLGFVDFLTHYVKTVK